MLTGSPSPRRYSRLPAKGAIWLKFVFSVRNRPTSSSGLTPSSSRRNTLSIKRSPKMTELLLCSATDSWASRRTVSGPRSLANARVVEPISVPAPPAARRLRAMAPRIASEKFGGLSASYSRPRASSPWLRTQAIADVGQRSRM